MEQQLRLFTGPDGKLQLPTPCQTPLTQSESLSNGAYGHNIFCQGNNPLGLVPNPSFVASPLPSSSSSSLSSSSSPASSSSFPSTSPASSSSSSSPFFPSTSPTPPISYLPHRDAGMTSAFSVPCYSPYPMQYFPLHAPATLLSHNPNEVIRQLNEKQQVTANEQAVRAQNPVESADEKKDQRKRVAKSSSEPLLQAEAPPSEPQEASTPTIYLVVKKEKSPPRKKVGPAPQVQKKETKRRTTRRETLHVGDGQYTVRHKELEPKISSNKDLNRIMASSPNVTDKVFSETEQVFKTKVVLYQDYFVALTDDSTKINKPEITNGSKRPMTQHNEKLKNKGFFEKRLGKSEPGGWTYFVKKSHP